MKDGIISLYEHLKRDQTLGLLTLGSLIGYLIIFIISKFFLSGEITIPSFITYIYIINTVLSLSVMLKDKLASQLIMSFNIIIQLICLICIIKSMR